MGKWFRYLKRLLPKVVHSKYNRTHGIISLSTNSCCCFRISDCSRWEELLQAMNFQLDLAFAGKINCEFRLLNNPDSQSSALNRPIRIGFNNSPTDNDSAYARLKEHLFENFPYGKTPLIQHLYEIVDIIKIYRNQLVENRQKAMILIATDGEVSDDEFDRILSQCKDLPITLIIRLCTNEVKIVNYWNEIERKEEFSFIEMVDTIDDYYNESVQVMAKNPWLNYNMILHRMREFGCVMKEFDKLDEELLSGEEMLKLCSLM
jgi:hypothetical protein